MKVRSKFRLIKLLTLLLCLALLFFPRTVHPSDRQVRLSVSLDQLKVEIPLKVQTNAGVKAYVENYFKDIPEMVKIADCESQFRQWEDGKTLEGKVNHADRGVMQINLTAHPDAIRVVDTLEGNLGYARHLYNLYGLQPWQSSISCWGRPI